MNFEPYNVVILAEDYEAMRDWYIAALGLELKQEWTEKYHYAELVHDDRYIVGIALAKEMNCEPVSPRKNTSLMQLKTDDIRGFFEQVTKHGAKTWGPNYDPHEDLGYGAFFDPEGNETWVIQPNAGGSI